jgi:hypothetical protein
VLFEVAPVGDLDFYFLAAMSAFDVAPHASIPEHDQVILKLDQHQPKPDI